MKHDDLVYDVGMYRGEDTQHYLDRGFRVVTVEANPALVEAGRRRFSDAIAAGRLTIVGAAVADHPGTVEFWIADELTILSSLDPYFVAYNQAAGIHYPAVQVRAILFADLLRTHGVPHYLKVDIEGADMLCLRALHEVSERPDYISVESAVTHPHSAAAVLAELKELWKLGYRRFNDVQQRRDPGFSSDLLADASGPFGDQLPGRWAPLGRALVRAAVIRAQFEVIAGRWARTLPARAVRRLRRSSGKPSGSGTASSNTRSSWWARSIA